MVLESLNLNISSIVALAGNGFGLGEVAEPDAK